ncbi:MAG: V-type ATPase subunit [Lachnospiraceae bacterium]|nr:V-type ATPase subunit [Lachnospiraceae bacterium]
MPDNSYVYAVARIRSLEMGLFGESTIEQLMACKTAENCMAFLSEHGWEVPANPTDAESMLKREQERTWETIRELKVDMSVFDILSYQQLYHNLKAAIKEICVGSVDANIFFPDCAVSKEDMLHAIQEKDYSILPEHMREAAKYALETMLQTRDGQLCDIIVDHAALMAIHEKGKHAKLEVLRRYAESVVSVADIKIAVRGAKTGKNRLFLERALAPCDSLDLEKLTTAALMGTEAVCTYLTECGFAEAVEALKESNSLFERWCDNQIIHAIQPQKYNSFTAGPLIAYVLARENEIKTVRIILTGKQNQLPEAFIRERIRDMYV